MSVDLSGLPELPNTAALRASATSAGGAGDAFLANGTEARTAWAPISDAIACSYNPGAIHTAMDKVVVHCEAIELSAGVIESALDAYCDEIDGIKDRYNAAVAAAQVCHVPSTDEDPHYAQTREAEAQTEVNAIATLMRAMEERCANTINAADPAAVTSPGFASTAYVGSANTALTEALDRLRVDRYNIEVSTTIRVSTLDISRLEIDFADGSRLTYTQIDLRETVVQTRTLTPVTEVGLDGSRRATLGEPPAWAKNGGKFLEGADVVLSAWGNYSEEWNEDLLQHPDMSGGEQFGSAAKSAVLGAGGSFGGSFGGALGGAALGTLICPGVGTVIGGVVGGIAGGIGGEWMGNTIDNLTDGDALVDSMSDAWDSLWG